MSFKATVSFDVLIGQIPTRYNPLPLSLLRKLFSFENTKDDDFFNVLNFSILSYVVHDYQASSLK